MGGASWEGCAQRPDLVLPANIPNVEFDLLVRDRLDVEAHGGDGGDVLPELEAVEDRWSVVRRAGLDVR